MNNRFGPGPLVAIALIALATAPASNADVLTFNIPAPILITETGTVRIPVTGPSAPGIATVNAITVTMAHEWLGDLAVTLVPPVGPEFTLFDVVGPPPDGSSAILGTYVESSDPSNPGFTLTAQPYRFAMTGADFAAAAATAEVDETAPLVPTNATYAAQAWSAGPFPAGTWQLVLEDLADLSSGLLTGVQIDYTPAGGQLSLNWNAPAPVAYGTALSATQLNATATVDGVTVPGTFTYSPAAGTVLPVGVQTLSVQFSPQDSTRFSSASTTTSITIQAAPIVKRQPLLTWNAPAPVVFGTPLSATQLNARATVDGVTVPGTFTYSPAAGTVLPVGVQTLSVQFSPQDTVSYSSGSATTSITVQSAPITLRQPLLTWNAPAPVVFGTALSATQLNATAMVDGVIVPGTFTYSPAAGTVLPVGVQTLSVQFSPQDTVSNSSASATTTLTIQSAPIVKRQPVLTWAAPAALVYGNALSGTQLNATATVDGATVPGTFAYSPAAGTVLPVGVQTLSVQFSPQDPASYNSASATTSITIQSPPVSKRQPTLTWNSPAPLTYGSPLSATQLNAIATIDGVMLPGSFTYSPAAGTILEVGVHFLSVQFAPQDSISYLSASMTTSISIQVAPVTQREPVLTWNPPTTMLSDTPLSSVQLDAKATVDGVAVLGSFAYSPPAGTMLAVGVQTLSVQFFPQDTTHFSSVKASVSITVQSAPIALRQPLLTWATPADLVYGTPLSATQLNVMATDNGVAVPGVFTYSPAAGTMLPVGVQTLSVQFAPQDSTRYSSASKTTSITVQPGPTSGKLIINWSSPAEVAYGTPLSSTQLNAAAMVDGVPVAGVFTYTPAPGVILPVGLHALSVQFSPDDRTRFANVMTTASISVSPAPLTIRVDNKSISYGAPLPQLTVSYIGLVNGDSAAAVLTAPVNVATPASAGSPAGSYPITAKGGSSRSYTISIENGTLTITRASLVVAVDDKTRMYGASLPILTARYNGFVGGDTAASLTEPVKVTTTANASSIVGTYPIVATGGASLNYSLFFSNGTLTVTPAPLLVSANAQSKGYGLPVPTLTASYSGFVNGDTAASLNPAVALTTTATANSPLGSYPITVTGGANPNYAIVLKNGTLTVGKSPLQVTANDVSKVYGAPLPTLTATYTGFANGDTAASLNGAVTLTTTATAASPVGTYPITLTGGESANYYLVLTPGTLTVTKAPLQVTPADVTKVYGAKLPALTASYSGFVNGDKPAVVTVPASFSTTATASSPVGSYPITATGGSSLNYDLVPGRGTLTVLKAPLRVRADDQTKPYGAPLPSFTASYSGFVNGDTVTSLSQPVTFTTTGTPTSPVGSYPITPAGDPSPNYTASFESGTLTVARALLTIAADDQVKVYGAPLPILTASASGFIKGDTMANLIQPVTFVINASAESPAGTYQIRPVTSANSNYTLILRTGTLTVTKAPLTITADDKAKEYGDPLPPLTASYAGLVNGDAPASLPQVLQVLTTATSSSPAGTYPITLSMADPDNYFVRLVNGTLTVADPARGPSFHPGRANIQADGTLLLQLPVPTGTRVRLEWSHDLKQWSDFGTKTSASGKVEFRDADILDTRLRFFRAEVLPP